MTGPDDTPEETPEEDDTPDTTEAAQPDPEPAGAVQDSPAGRGRGARQYGGSYGEGAAMRALRSDIEGLRGELQRGLREARDELRDDFRHRVRDLASHLTELMPKVSDLEDRIAAVDGGASSSDTDGPTDGSADGPAATADAGAGPGSGADKGPPPTPAAGWDEMDRGTAEIAWRELAVFVDEVLHRQYRLSRLQVPDCWPVHPRMVREIAWLRANYLEARDQEAEADSASMSWHIRAVPGFLVNTADAVDMRECRPGVHRLTGTEIDACLPAVTAAREAGQPPPAPTHETGPDRPRLRPEHFPTRRTDGHRGGSSAAAAAAAAAAGPQAPSFEDLAESRVLVDACHRDYWLDYYREASAADLATRPG